VIGYRRLHIDRATKRTPVAVTCNAPDLHRFRDKAAFGEPVGSEPAPFDFIQDIWISLSRVLTCALFADPKFNHFDTILACD